MDSIRVSETFDPSSILGEATSFIGILPKTRFYSGFYHFKDFRLSLKPMKLQSTERFTNRVDNYIRYRPDYPSTVISYLQEKINLYDGATIADIGSGTGIFTQTLLTAGYNVIAVEPNEAMRTAADQFLASNAAYKSLDGTAEQTNIDDQFVEMIVCAQAFHWFNNAATLKEFQRILKPGGSVALIWNNRLVDADAFSMEYDALLKSLGSDYNEVNHQKLTEKDFKAFFRNGDYQLVVFPNEQVLDENGLIGRAQSSSYVPAERTSQWETFLKSLKAIFQKYQQDGKIKFLYGTEVYLGKI